MTPPSYSECPRCDGQCPCIGSQAFAGLGGSALRGQTRTLRTWIIEQGEPDPVSAIQAVINENHKPGSSTQAGWQVLLSYELGTRIEPKAVHLRSKTPFEASGFPLAVIQRWVCCDDHKGESGGYELGPMRSSMGKEGYMGAVERVRSYIGAGDIYQANIAHQLSSSFRGNARLCFDALIAAAKPRLGSMMIFDHHGVRHAIASVSPEVFIECDLQAGMIRTEPMKGTRPLGTAQSELRDSIKDRAELDMITDLMRNDLGRVCRPGSVRVAQARKIESHQSGVLQASSVIEGRLAKGIGLGEVINATFPPGSVTGAPKVRAMQIIDEIEGVARDSYCGSMLMLDDNGTIKSAVLIRTAHIWGEIDPLDPESVRNGQFVYPVGAGIVADSLPASEWAETLVKAEILERALGVDLSDIR